MPNPLTKDARVVAEKLRISRLTNPHSQHFKVILSHQIESSYGFASLSNGGGTIGARGALKILKAFGKFIDDTVKMTITEVENKYKRQPYSNDGTHDPETGAKVQIEHFCLYPDGDPPRGLPDNVRIHGYFRPGGGYFVVTRLDWFHSYNTSDT